MMNRIRFKIRRCINVGFDCIGREFFCILICLLLFIKGNFAQTSIYHIFPDSNTFWGESSWELVGSCSVNDEYKLFIKKDTVIAAQQYHKIYASGYSYSVNCSPSGNIYFYNIYKGAIRQNIFQKKVF